MTALGILFIVAGVLTPVVSGLAGLRLDLMGKIRPAQAWALGTFGGMLSVGLIGMGLVCLR